MEGDIRIQIWSISGGFSEISRSSYEVSLWKHIQNRWSIVLRFTWLGNGLRISFCHDHWCGTRLLKDAYHESYNISRDKDAKVGDYLERANGGIRGNLLFVLSLDDWDLDSMNTFLGNLYAAHVNSKEKRQDDLAFHQ